MEIYYRDSSMENFYPMIFLLVVIGGLSRVAAQNPNAEGTVVPGCTVIERGNRSFVQCTFSFDVKVNRTNFFLLYRQIEQPENQIAEVALSCHWPNAAQEDKPTCVGMDGYNLTDTAIGNTVTIEVPRVGLQLKKYTCQLALSGQAPAGPCCAQTTSTTTTTTTTTPKQLDESRDDTSHNYIVAVVVLSVLLVTGVIAIIVRRLVRRSRRRSLRPSQDGTGESGIREHDDAGCYCFSLRVINSPTATATISHPLQSPPEPPESGSTHPPPYTQSTNPEYRALLPGIAEFNVDDGQAGDNPVTHAIISDSVHDSHRMQDPAKARVLILGKDSSQTKNPEATTAPPRMTDYMTATSPRMKDSMMLTPHRLFSFTPKTADDTKEPGITSIVSTQHGTLVMADNSNNKVKVVELNYPYTVTASITLDEKPHRLALLSENRVAVTTDNKVIYILRIDTSEITVQSRVETEREYVGICAEGDDKLIVGCNKGGEGLARVDIIDHSGKVLRMVIDHKIYSRLSAPDSLCTVSSHVYIADLDADVVLKVEVKTGKVVEVLQHTAVESPRQVCVDNTGNIYIASEFSERVMVRSGNGEWRCLLDADQHSEGGYNWPYGVCVTASGIIATAWSSKFGNASLLTGYELK